MQTNIIYSSLFFLIIEKITQRHTVPLSASDLPKSSDETKVESGEGLEEG